MTVFQSSSLHEFHCPYLNVFGSLVTASYRSPREESLFADVEVRRGISARRATPHGGAARSSGLEYAVEMKCPEGMKVERNK